MPVELTACRWRRAAIVPALALAFLTVSSGLPDALADAAAGSAAFEKGDYVRAMAEWASAAERGDPDAEFGLGMLYERGDGAVRQSYKEADRWYQKAAEHDHVGAQYRLALIWSAGSDGFPADLAEAYKWILLASERGLATEVKAQLEAIMDRAQQADGKKRAAKWKEERAAKKKLEALPPGRLRGCVQRGPSLDTVGAFLSPGGSFAGNPAGALAGRSRLCRAPNNFRRCPGRPPARAPRHCRRRARRARIEWSPACTVGCGVCRRILFLYLL